jgi:hypothetical protein
MTGVVHKMHLQSDEHFGKRLPPLHFGHLLVEIPLAMRASISMTFRYRRTIRGPQPAWLKAASDIRFVDHQGDDGTTLFFEAPTLGEAADELYQQKALFPEMQPDPQDTGFDLLGDVLRDVQAQNSDSDHFDPPLLNRIARFQKVFKRGPFCQVDFTSRRNTESEPARFNPSLIESANSLLGRTPAPQRIRLVGNLDGIQASTQRFSILLDSGEKASGVFTEDQIDNIQNLWRKRVLVLDTAVYRASGRLLRIEAEEVKCDNNEPAMFSELPKPPPPDLARPPGYRSRRRSSPSRLRPLAP